MINPFLLAHGKGRGFLRVKGAKPHVVSPGFLEGHVIGNDLDDGGAVTNLGDLFGVNHDRVS